MAQENEFVAQFVSQSRSPARMIASGTFIAGGRSASPEGPCMKTASTVGQRTPTGASRPGDSATRRHIDPTVIHRVFA
jgi:hypothetical protein